jgi:hypothetical protein
MKKQFGLFLFACILATAGIMVVVGVSCNTDKCKTIVCANGSYCQLGNCVCPVGWEGPSCETESRAKFLGNWMVYEKGSSSFSAQYPITILKDTFSTVQNNVRISNFNNYFKGTILASVVHDTITIPNQELEGKTVFGKGYIYTSDDVNYYQYGSIRMSYEIIDSATFQINDYGYDGITDGSLPSQWSK